MIQRFLNISSILMPGALVVSIGCRRRGPGCSRPLSVEERPLRPRAALASPAKNIASDSRCFELRTYTVKGEGPGSIDLLHSRFRENTNRLFRKHGMTIVGFWQPAEPGHGKHADLSARVKMPRPATRRGTRSERIRSGWRSPRRCRWEPRSSRSS